jgi:hypothetical protein
MVSGPQEIRAEWRPSAPDQTGAKAMPRRNSLTRRLLRHLFLISLASCLLAVFGRGWDEWDEDEDPKPQKPAPNAEPVRKSKGRRFATAITFSALFFAGLALSAGAGNSVRALLEDGTTDAASTSTETDTTGTTTDEAPMAVVRATKLQAREAAPAAAPKLLTAKAVATRGAAVGNLRAVDRADKRSAVKHGTGQRSHPKAAKHQKLHKQAKPKQPLDAEASLPGATVWLYQDSPDPTPPAARLRLRFARELVRYSRAAHVDWAFVLAVLRTQGHNGRVPASRADLKALALRLGTLGVRPNSWAAALSYSADTSFADKTVALRHYYRAVGMASLVYGLRSQKRDLEDRVLHDDRIQIYPGGRQDIASHKVDVRVLAVMLYLAGTYHEVLVTCLISGHRLYARPGVISAHIYGRAVDIAGLGGVSIYGHQQPGGVTERAVRALLMLPGRMLPMQIISLIGLGGPSFPLANHYDHIHVGY